jgi:hypothetical protein
MSMNGKAVRRSAALLLALALTACGAGRRYHDSEMDFGSIRTVAVMPFANFSRETIAAERVRDVFTNTLLATNAVYVVPPGETARGIGRVNVLQAPTPSVEEVVKLGSFLKADAVITGVVKEYGEIRSGNATANSISLSLQMYETQTGKLVWSASTTKGGISMAERLFGGGGAPLNDVTEAAVDDLLRQLFK